MAVFVGNLVIVGPSLGQSAIGVAGGTPPTHEDAYLTDDDGNYITDDDGNKILITR